VTGQVTGTNKKIVTREDTTECPMLIKGSHDLGRQHMMPLPNRVNSVFYLEHPPNYIPGFVSMTEKPDFGKPYKPKEPCPTPSTKLFSSDQILAIGNLGKPL
jgi:hypothetical protein